MRADGKKGVAIYAAKTVRGQIIAKSLAVCGIPASFDSDPTAAIAKIEKGEAALLVVDLADPECISCLGPVDAESDPDQVALFVAMKQSGQPIDLGAELRLVGGCLQQPMR